MKKILGMLLGTLLVIGICGCQEEKVPPDDNPPVEDKCLITEGAKPINYEQLGEFSPTLFDEDTYKIAKTTTLTDGAYIDTVEFNLNNGNKVIAQMVNVDLDKVDIKAGTKNNSVVSALKATPYEQLKAYEKNNAGETVIAAVNADFFGSVPVNAFVKDGRIIKEQHNDNGIYDYTNPSADLPASMPMLFGISSDGSQAQIGAIVDNKSVEETVKTKVRYEVSFMSEHNMDSDTSKIETNVTYNASASSENMINVFNDRTTTLIPGKLLKVEICTNDIVKHGKIVEITNITSSQTFKDEEDKYFYVLVPNDYNVEVGNYVAYYINSEGDKWMHYDTIIGARQALVLNGEIPSTVKLENSNGAQTTDIPRTAVGIKPNGDVVIVSIEALRYYDLSQSETDGYGVNLPELAELMRYYGCAMAANFDGGGSTNLLVKEENKDLAVWTRSADYGTYELEDSRPVINTLLVVKKND